MTTQAINTDANSALAILNAASAAKNSSSSAAGASALAGIAASNPYGAAIAAGGQVLSKAIDSQKDSGVTSAALNNQVSFNNGPVSVSYGSSSISASQSTKQAQDNGTPAANSTASGLLEKITSDPVYMLGVGAFILLLVKLKGH